ncbi:hypothetical protein, partial [Salmonella sp. s54836]|uniref:hypothetical protein n=1 Tax=Salmonella sp. s54836 TaxID=3159673 RepID=UPI003981324D
MKSSDLASHRLSESRSSIESTPALQPLEYYTMTGVKQSDVHTQDQVPYTGSASHYHISQDPSRYIEIELDKG